MSEGIRTLGKTLVIDPNIRAVLREHRWVTLPAQEWNFLLRIAGSNWRTARVNAKNRKRAERLRKRIGTVHVELVRGIGYRLGSVA